MPRRRSLLLTPVAFCLAACGPRSGTDEDPPPPDPSAAPEQASVAIPIARELLAAAETALNDHFGPMTWEDDSREQIGRGSAACSYSTLIRRCDAYLGHDSGTPEEIAEVLTPVLEDHGFSALSAPTGGVGGWLSATSTRAGLDFTFRSKGYAEIRVSGRVEAEQCDLPGPSDGG